MIYVSLDACIYNRILTQGQPGSTMECFEELKRLATEGKAQVVVPEIVMLEFEKFCRELDNQYAVSVEKFRKDVADTCGKKHWNEIDDLKQSVLSHIDAEASKKRATLPDRARMVKEWLTSNAVVRVPFDSDIWLLGKRRLMSGRMPPTERKSDQDACLIESLLKVIPRDQEIYFATENTRDFAVEVPNKGFAFHPLLAEDLPKTKFYVDLCSLVEALRTGKAAPEPTTQELAEAAQEAVAQPPFLVVLRRIRPIIERYLESLEPGEDNCIRNPRFKELYHEFSKGWVRNSARLRGASGARRICKQLDDVLAEMVKHNWVIEYEAVRMKHSTTRHQMALERLASQFLDLHDDLLEMWSE